MSKANEQPKEKLYCAWCGRRANKIILFEGAKIKVKSGPCCIELVQMCDEAIDNDKS
jgi:hypothetical protein